ncbi:tetratricopeptide repeat protein [uncultured Kordia sp.]|uniref:tetratricopeptide repeat protein n=1 Tax=uncultured Kordia sp. TaxID=507699 RepID=UPI00261A3199|nr:tetratricopeptide repeat protein [uncultured Kordia sp.]
MKNILITMVFLASSFSVKAQVKDSIVDALKSQIEKAATDSIRLSLKADLGNRLAFFDRSIAKEVHLEVEKELDDKGYTSLYYQQLKAEVLYSLSSMHSNLGENSEALRYANKGFELAASINYHRISGKCISNIGSVYKKMNDFDKAKLYYRRALEIQKKDTVARGRVISYNRLGALYVEEKKYDSAIYYFHKALAVPKITKKYQIRVRTNIANTYIKEHRYDIAEQKIIENLAFLNTTGLYQHLSNNHLSLAKVYHKKAAYCKATSHIDSAIVHAKKIRSHLLLKWSYSRKAEIMHDSKDYAASREAFLLYDKYKDSLISESRTKRLADLEYAYQFKKEKQLAAVHLKNESTKKQLYFALIFVVLLFALLSIYIIVKRKERKIALAENELKLKEIEKLKADLVLANRENELKKVVVENSITEEVLNRTLDDIKEIITFENEGERKSALKSLSAVLLSEKTSKSSTSSLQNYLDEVSMDFKVLLDTHFTELKAREKELLCMMKLGLSSTEISKLFNTTLASIKSSRYRIRKKLGLESSDDIIAFLENTTLQI